MESHNPDRQEIETRRDDTLVGFLLEYVPAWQKDAACRNADPTLFFPQRGDKNKHVKEEYCNNCLVRVQCLEYQLEITTSQTDSGIWGATSVRERRAIRQGRSGGKPPSTPEQEDRNEYRTRRAETLISQGYCHPCSRAHHPQCTRFKAEAQSCSCPTCNERQARLDSLLHQAFGIAKEVFVVKRREQREPS